MKGHAPVDPNSVKRSQFKNWDKGENAFTSNLSDNELKPDYMRRVEAKRNTHGTISLQLEERKLKKTFDGQVK
jgi:hypothetical protein